jgi:carboxyl-terminal processing protease
VLLTALVLVGIISAAALFMAGFTLGQREAEQSGRGEAQAALAPFLEAYRRVTTEHVGDAPPQRLVEGALRGLFQALGDPYSSYMTQAEYEEGLADISGEFEGVGAELALEDDEGAACLQVAPACRARIVRVLADSPAEGAGIRDEDELLSVDGKGLQGRSLAEVVSLVRGPRDTTVTLVVRRDGRELELPVVRGVIRTEDVRSEMLADGHVGYLRIDGFSGDAAEDFRSALTTQLDAGVQRFIIDLRDDPGGYVDAAVDIASLFVASGPVYWEEHADGRAVAVEVSGGGPATDPRLRVAVLVNGGTASASEILAGALQDSGRAVVVGERTFGKGSIQQWHLLPEGGGGVRISVARWLTPTRRSIDGTGIEPDVPVADEGSRGEEDDAALQAAIRLLLDGSEGQAQGGTAGPAASAGPAGSRGPGASPDGSPGPARGSLPPGGGPEATTGP